MRIGVSVFGLEGGRNGLATYASSLIGQLAVLDSDLEYVVFGPQRDLDVLPASSHRLSYRVVPERFAGPLASIAWHNTRLPQLAKREGLDLLHVPSYRRIPLVKSCPVVATVHDLAPLSVPGKYDLARTLYARYAVPGLIRRCDHVLTPSEFTRSEVLRSSGIPETRVTAVHSGIDANVYSPMASETARAMVVAAYGIRAPFLVYVSRIEHPGKNHVRLIQAFEAWKQSGDFPHELVLVGERVRGAEHVVDRVEQSPVRDAIHLLGFVPVEHLVALYSACELMVHPSLLEGFGFPVLEAAACGARVACSDGSALREIAAGRFPCFDPWDPASIQRCIQQVLGEAPGEQARLDRIAYARGFDWSETARRVVAVYRSVHQGARSSVAAQDAAGGSS